MWQSDTITTVSAAAPLPSATADSGGVAALSSVERPVAALPSGHAEALVVAEPADTLPPRCLTHPDTLMAHGDTLRDVAQHGGSAWLGGAWPEPADTLTIAEAVAAKPGVAGDPAPTPLSADDVVTATLLACFLLAMAAVAKSRDFIVRQAKAFFRRPRSHRSATGETPAEVRFQSFFVLQGCLLMGVLLHSLDLETGYAEAFGHGQHVAMAAYVGLIAAYIAVRHGVQAAANMVFFGAKANAEWVRAALFVAAMEGAALLPVTLLRVYFNLPIAAAVNSVAAIVVAARLLSLFKCHAIFFRQTLGLANMVVYFAALELAPLAAICGILAQRGLGDAAF